MTDIAFVKLLSSKQHIERLNDLSKAHALDYDKHWYV
jgi:hypothetical protein